MTIRPNPKPAPRVGKPKQRIAAKRATPRRWTCKACRTPSTGTVCQNCRTRKTSKLTTGIDAKLDTALRRFTLMRAMYRCERCGKSGATITLMGGELQDAHYQKRRKRATRWHPDNRAALCAKYVNADGKPSCHVVIDTYTPAHEQRAFFVKLRGEEAIAEVDELTRSPWDRDRASIISMLRGRGIPV